MKYIKLLAVAVLVSVFPLASCESYFDVQLDDQATLEEIFKQKNTTRNYLAHLYSFIPLDEEIVGSNGWVSARADEAQFSWYQYVNYISYRTGNYSSGTPTSTATFNYWPTFYVGIAQCITFLENIHLNEEDTPTVIAYMKAEARFLRAYYYFCLFRQYGPVFLWYDEVPDENMPPESFDRHTVEENINYIVSELDAILNDLPLKATDIEEQDRWMGRVTRGAALALKSRVLLYAASPLYNGCTLYKGKMKNMRGDYLFPQTDDQNKWELAAQAAKAVIDLDMYQLHEDASRAYNINNETDRFEKGAASYQGVLFEPWNKETIWGWWWRTSASYSSYGTVGGSLTPALPPNFSGVLHGFGGIAPSLKLVDSYPMWETGRYPVKGYQGRNDLSKPIVDALSGYTGTGFTDGYKQPLTDWGSTIKAHNSCIGRDPRFYVSVVPNGFYWPNKTLNKLFTCYNSIEATSPYKPTQDCIRVGYAWRRLYKTNTSMSEAGDYYGPKYVYPAFRMAEIYLSYAEACNEKPQRDENTALEYLNKVRERAGLNKIEEAYPEITGNQELLRWCIQKERMVEFGLEAMRHYDACRWMIAKAEYPGLNWTLNVSATTYEASYNRVSTVFAGSPTVFRDKDYLFPISSLQLAEMTNMTQNYGH